MQVQLIRFQDAYRESDPLSLHIAGEETHIARSAFVLGGFLEALKNRPRDFQPIDI
tara:strand:+ start:263 stop:430 length:168 start_codon:yes stop_codon:yes gene_type:complete